MSKTFNNILLFMLALTVVLLSIGLWHEINKEKPVENTYTSSFMAANAFISSWNVLKHTQKQTNWVDIPSEYRVGLIQHGQVAMVYRDVNVDGVKNCLVKIPEAFLTNPQQNDGTSLDILSLKPCQDNSMYTTLPAYFSNKYSASVYSTLKLASWVKTRINVQNYFEDLTAGEKIKLPKNLGIKKATNNYTLLSREPDGTLVYLSSKIDVIYENLGEEEKSCLMFTFNFKEPVKDSFKLANKPCFQVPREIMLSKNIL